MFSPIKEALEWIHDYRLEHLYSHYQEKFKQQVIAANKRRGGSYGR